MANLEEEVAKTLSSGRSGSFTVDGHRFNIERVGRAKVPGVTPKQIAVDGKIVHEFSFPQSDDDIFFKMLIEAKDQAKITEFEIKSGFFKFSDLTHLLGPGLAVPLSIALKLIGGNSEQLAILKIVQAIGKALSDEYF